MSKETKHTPGPWARTNLSVHTQSTAKRGALVIARVLEAGIETDAADSPEQATANARLIAAAPEPRSPARRGARDLPRAVRFHGDPVHQQSSGMGHPDRHHCVAVSSERRPMKARDYISIACEITTALFIVIDVIRGFFS